MTPKDPSPQDNPNSTQSTTQPPTQKPTTPKVPVAGIGASAGGIEALKAFFGALPEGLGIAFVVVIHLSPEHRSQLASILTRTAKIPVEEVNDIVPLTGDRVYVIPPDRQLEITDTHVSASPFDEPRGHRFPIDILFRSLAEAHGDGFAIILSGGGSDGTVGIKSIKEKGGLVLVQDPHEAAFASMPQAAIATGLVDLVLPVGALAARVGELARSKQRLRQTLQPTKPERLDPDNEAMLKRILAHLQTRTGHDFIHYKRATVLRRIARRMQMCRKDTLGGYYDVLKQNAEEARTLFNDLLISVTMFFRDPQAWEALRTQVVSPLIKTLPEDSPVRIWVVGCATGEETYSLTILLLEESERQERQLDVQIFATDIDANALAIARQGCYPAAIAADIGEARLRRFFRQVNDRYYVSKEVRDCILFANHSLLKDPPFSRIDLISCRNLLIYLDRKLQEQVFDLFHYALKPSGYLFLGIAENAEGENFRILNKKFNLFQRREGTGMAPPELLSTAPLIPPSPKHPPGRPPPATAATMHLKNLEELAPPSILVNDQGHAVHLSATAGRYLQPPAGPLTLDVTTLVRLELQHELSSALRRALHHGETVLSPPLPVRFNGTPRQVALWVHPRQDHQTGEYLALVLFIEGGEAALIAKPGDTHDVKAINPFQEELRQTEAHLRTITEKYEAANEELRAANEELQSINEEYRSTAEELETSKEELQSINEELQTVNSELKNKLDEISDAHNDLENLIAATEIGTLFLDRELRIQRLTPTVTGLFNITMSDRERPIGDFTHGFDYNGFEADARQVLSELTPIEREVHHQSGTIYQVRLRPYRTLDDRINGVVITFVDITERHHNEQQVQNAREFAESIIDTLHEGLLILTPDLRVKSANHTFYHQFTVRPEDTEDRLIYELGNGQWNIPELRYLLEDVLPNDKVITNYRVKHTFENVGERVMQLNASRLDHSPLILLAIEDITKQARTLAALDESEQRFRVLTEAATQAVWETDARGVVVADSPSWRAYTGQTLEQWLGYGWVNAIHPDDRKVVEAQWREAVAAGRNFNAEYRLRHLPTGWRWSNALAAPIRNAEGAIHKWVGMNIDISERKRAEDAVRQSEQRYRLLVESAQEYAIFMVNTEGRITSWNFGAERIFGYTAAEIVGQDVTVLFTPEDRAAGMPQWEMETTTREGRANDDRWQQRKDGTRFWASGVMEKLANGNGILHGFAKVLRDNTERKQTEDALKQSEGQLQRQTEELRGIDQQKNQFLGMLGHELRNPLAAIRNSLQVLATLDGDKPAHEQNPLRHRTLAALERQSQHMTRLVNDLLDITRINKGKIILQRQRLALAECIEEVVANLRPRLDAARLQLNVELPETSLYVDADPVRFTQVLDNLLSNAIKFTTAGGNITIAAERLDGEVLIRVRDTGIGITPAGLAGLFDPFNQGDSQPNRSQHGLGLGLALVKNLVELHGGRVDAHSEGLGKGSEFRVRLPLAERSLEPAPAPHRAAPGPKRMQRILVVDDNPDITDPFAILLTSLGHEVEAAYDGEAALAAAERLGPTVAFIDIGMPGMDGYELARRLRRAFPPDKLTLVAVTGYGQGEIVTKTREAGFEHHLLKPVEIDAVIELLDGLK